MHMDYTSGDKIQFSLLVHTPPSHSIPSTCSLAKCVSEGLFFHFFFFVWRRGGWSVVLRHNMLVESEHEHSKASFNFENEALLLHGATVADHIIR